jgi:hypothetical protein
MEREVDRGDWLARLASCGIESVDGVHRLCRGIEGAAADLISRRIHQRKGREHVVAEEFQNLAAALA